MSELRGVPGEKIKSGGQGTQVSKVTATPVTQIQTNIYRLLQIHLEETSYTNRKKGSILFEVTMHFSL